MLPPFPAIAKVKQMNNRLSLVFCFLRSLTEADRTQKQLMPDGSCQTVVLLFYVLLILSTVIGTAMSATRLTSGSQQNLNVSVNSSASTKGTINCLEKSLSRHVWSA
jgi:hypothetical protein